MRNDCSINFHLSKLSIATFSILYDISLVRLKEKIDVDHSWEWKGKSCARISDFLATSVIFFPFSSSSQPSPSLWENKTFSTLNSTDLLSFITVVSHCFRNCSFIRSRSRVRNLKQRAIISWFITCGSRKIDRRWANYQSVMAFFSSWKITL